MNRPTTGNGRFWAYTGTILGGATSIAANIQHSLIPPTGAPADWTPAPFAIGISVAWPVFLFVAIEILARVPWPTGRSYAVLRYTSAIPVAAVAAFVSWRHMAGLLHHYGEDALVCVLGPFAIDGLMVMSSAALIATGARLTNRAATITTITKAAPVVARTADSPVPAPTHRPAPTPLPHVATPAETVVPVAPAAPAPAITRTATAIAATVTTPVPDSAPAPATTPTTSVQTTPLAAASAYDSTVNTADAAATGSVSTELLTRARQIARVHLSTTGTPITVPQLAVRLRISSETAQAVKAALNPDPRPAHHNGTKVLETTR